MGAKYNATFGLAITLAFTVLLNESSLRREIGKHAIAINQLNSSIKDSSILLLAQIGHTHVEIASGAALGMAVAFSL